LRFTFIALWTRNVKIGVGCRQAVEAYEKAVGMEPKNESLQQALQKASVQAHKQEAEGKHTFKAKSVRGKLNGSLGGVKKVRSEDRAPNRSNGPLSFDPDDDEEHE
jgi:hypothetical protein